MSNVTQAASRAGKMIAVMRSDREVRGTFKLETGECIVVKLTVTGDEHVTVSCPDAPSLMAALMAMTALARLEGDMVAVEVHELQRLVLEARNARGWVEDHNLMVATLERMADRLMTLSQGH